MCSLVTGVMSWLDLPIILDTSRIGLCWWKWRSIVFLFSSSVSGITDSYCFRCSSLICKNEPWPTLDWCFLRFLVSYVSLLVCRKCSFPYHLNSTTLDIFLESHQGSQRFETVLPEFEDTITIFCVTKLKMGHPHKLWYLRKPIIYPYVKLKSK